jgi:riboflavin kinase/FMN adenylyltransferase
VQVHYDLKNFQVQRPVVTIGVFDGVHKGHRKIVTELHQKAQEMKGSSVVVTLWPHPRIVLKKNTDNLKLLNSLEEKITLLEKTGIEHLVVLPFTKDFANLSSCEFIEQYLVNKIGVYHLVVGFNHQFGKDRDGGYTNLKSCAALYHFSIEQMSAERDNQNNISSTRIREYLLSDQLEEANRLLGSPYPISGHVVEGNKIGRTIGFPTANIEPTEPYKLIPCDGVYAVNVFVGNQHYSGMLNIGTRPTLNHKEPQRLVEVHIIDFNKGIYDELIHVSFRKKIRNERKFNNLMELAGQLERDKLKVKAYFAQEPVR